MDPYLDEQVHSSPNRSTMLSRSCFLTPQSLAMARIREGRDSDIESVRHDYAPRIAALEAQLQDNPLEAVVTDLRTRLADIRHIVIERHLPVLLLVVASGARGASCTRR